MQTVLRAPTDSQLGDIHEVVRRAFGSETEADLVALLRQRGNSRFEAVAMVGEHVVGHIVASPIELVPAPGAVLPDLAALGIAPLSVVPELQGQGIGGLLMHHLIDAARHARIDALFLLGHPGYYPRFGFARSQVGNEYGATDAFMSLELTEKCLAGLQATALYVSAFGEVGA